jgi:hypothetical protein
VPKKSAAQEIRFWGKIGFLKPCAQTCPRNPLPKKSDFGEKSDFSNRVPKRAQEIRCPRNPIFEKNRISQTVPKRAQEIRCPRNPIFEKNRISQTVCPNVPKKSVAQEIRFWGKIGFLKPCAQTYPRNPIFLKHFF